MKKFWICYVEGIDGGSHYQHSTMESAKQEAERLQRMPSNQHGKVYVMELMCYCEISEPRPPIEWHADLKEA